MTNDPLMYRTLTPAQQVQLRKLTASMTQALLDRLCQDHPDLDFELYKRLPKLAVGIAFEYAFHCTKQAPPCEQ